jgi:2-keto-4-pentenoate hydratase/2-oxohepta-3-ene-1,7-dioic acid hydratase in catechol pathway
LKLLRYGEPSRESPGILDPDGNIRSLDGIVADISGDSVTPEGIQRISDADVSALPLIQGSPRIGPCVGNVGKFICIGLNYADHAAEADMPIPAEPEVFAKATSAICGPYDEVIKPRNGDKLDWEVELAIVIGKRASYISEDEASLHIAGYCICNDVSERAFQLEKGTQWDKGKGCDTFGPIGPWLVTAGEIEDPLDLRMWLDVNGKRFQDGSTGTMIFSPAFLVSYLSQFMSLQPGDVISTGTPPGVGLGRKPPTYLNEGDVMELGIEGLGAQRQVVIPYLPFDQR